MKTEELNIQVPKELIAQEPLPNRQDSKLLLINKQTGEVSNGGTFNSILDYLDPGDLLIFNNSKVIPARLTDRSTRRVILILSRKSYNSTHEVDVLVEQGVLALGTPYYFGEDNSPIIFIPTKEKEKVGKREERIMSGVMLATEEQLEKYGTPPVPPYIKDYHGNPNRYQTVYASPKGSTAAPTAGLHFTPELINSLAMKGILMQSVTLHISIDTFMPILEENTEEHRIYTEWCRLPKHTEYAIQRAKDAGRRVICVGTTAVRTVESFIGKANTGNTSLFISPGYKFKVVDAMITNFHYPKSTNLLLVSSFAGLDLIKKAYNFAIEEKYRFYSFGDSSFIF